MSKLVEQYVLEESLGQDPYGFEVFRGKHSVSGEAACIFSMARSVYESPDFFKGVVANQVQISRKLNHPNLLRFRKLVKSPSVIYTVWEALGVPLKDQLAKLLSETEHIIVMRQLAAGVRELHALNIVHLSLHPRWVWLYGGCQTVKIGNFSHAVCLNSETHTYNYQLSVMKAVETLAPELKLNKPASLKADVYSLGMIFGWMRYQTPDFRFRLTKELNLRDPIAELINKMTIIDPSHRIDIEAVCAALQQQLHSPAVLNKQARTLTTHFSKTPDPTINRSLTPTVDKPREPATAGIKLKTLSTLRNKNTSEDKYKQAQLKTRSVTRPDVTKEISLKLHINKLLKERVQYGYLLAVCNQLLKDDGKSRFNSRPQILGYLLSKKAKLVADRCRILLKQPVDPKAYRQDVLQLHNIVEKEITMVEEYYRSSRQAVKHEQIKPELRENFQAQLHYQLSVNSQFFAFVLRDFVKVNLPAASSVLPSQKRNSPTFNPNDPMKVRATLQLLLRLLDCHNIERFCEDFLNETEPDLQSQPYLQHIALLSAQSLYQTLMDRLS